MSTLAHSVEVDLAPHLESCFWFDAVESSYDVAGVRGRVPEWLRGTWYVNGPAGFMRGEARQRHWLDGDGMVTALRFGEDGLRFTTRFIQTRKRRDETAAGHFLYRQFGAAFPGDRLRRDVMLEPPVNVSVYPYAGRLLALGEQTLPYELDLESLETRGEYDFHGSLNEVSPFAAHAKLDGGLLNFGVSFSAARPMLHVYQFDDAGHLLWRRRFPLSHPHSLHDFGFTPSRVVFFLSPLLMDFSRFWDGASVVDSLDWKPELGSRILIAPRSAKGAEAFTVEAGGGYCLHIINSFETDRRLTLDLLLLDAPVYPQYQLSDLFSDVPHGRPARYTIDLETRRLVSVDAISYTQSPDFPSIVPAFAGREANDFWMLGMSHSGRPGRKFFDELVHGSWADRSAADVYRAQAGEYLGAEPAVIVNPNAPAEAVVIAQLHKPTQRATEIVIFDAFTIRNGPLVSIPLRDPIHPGFHSSFAPSWLHAG